MSGDNIMTCFWDLCCRIKYYNNSLFHNVQRDFIAQTGDPTGTGKGGDSIYGCVAVFAQAADSMTGTLHSGQWCMPW
jgi:cyclophilin family peptidyl-prolyl cis-trans isomerase